MATSRFVFLCLFLSACATTDPAPRSLARTDFTYDVDVPTLQVATEDSLRNMGFDLSQSVVEPGGGMVRATRAGSPDIVIQLAPTLWGSVARVQAEGSESRSLPREIHKQIALRLGS